MIILFNSACVSYEENYFIYAINVKVYLNYALKI
jgi:hypothetical protein